MKQFSKAGMGQVFKPSRRDFLKATGLSAGGLLLGAAVPGAVFSQNFEGGHLNVFVRIERDNVVTVVCGLSEMGQGVFTAIPQLLAEELDVPWSSVKVEQSPADPAFKNPIFGMQRPPAVRLSIPRPLRADPQGRRLGAHDADQCRGGQVEGRRRRVQQHRQRQQVMHKGKKATYGSLAVAASKLPPVPDAKLKDPKDFKIIGKGLKRLDTAAKVNGSAKFGMDVKLPGLLTAVIAHPPVLGGKPASDRRLPRPNPCRGCGR